MLTYWLSICSFLSVASQQIGEENRVHIPKMENCLLECDREFRCLEVRNCDSLQYHYDLRNDKHSDKRELLIYGHNGLRNRLALILDTCDMLRMSWDDDLAELSNRHHRNCEQKIVCSSKVEKSSLDINEERKLFQKVFIGNTSHLGRNSYFHENIYSTNFFESAVGNWYMEHMQIEFPKKIKNNEKIYYKLLADNSFTHIINPQTHRVGCSYARFHNGLSLVCYYFPYIHNNTVFLRLKPKDYQCPYNFPILDPVFKRLCGYAVYS